MKCTIRIEIRMFFHMGALDVARSDEGIAQSNEHAMFLVILTCISFEKKGFLAIKDATP